MGKIYDMLVIGGGPGGYTAALYGARAGLSVLVIEKLSAGGQMATTEQVENYPGFDEPIDGFELGERMQRGAERFGAESLLATVTEASLEGAGQAGHDRRGRSRGADGGTRHRRVAASARRAGGAGAGRPRHGLLRSV